MVMAVGLSAVDAAFWSASAHGHQVINALVVAIHNYATTVPCVDDDIHVTICTQCWSKLCVCVCVCYIAPLQAVITTTTTSDYIV